PRFDGFNDPGIGCHQPPQGGICRPQRAARRAMSGPTQRTTLKMGKRWQTANAPSMPPGLAARGLAVNLVAGVLIDKRPLAQVLAQSAAQFTAMEPRDRALARAVAATALRRQGELELVLKAFLER